MLPAVMGDLQQAPDPHHDQAENTYRVPCATDILDYRIRADSNPLQEDHDVEENIFYRITPGSQVTNDEVETCAKRFSSYYGVWSETAWRAMGVWAKAGEKIRMGPKRLRAQSLPEGANNILVTAMTEAGGQVGHCFVSQWVHNNDRVWWITQLLVQPSYRNQRRATKMLQAIISHFDIGMKSDQKDFVGVASSHPYTICAVLRVFGRGIESLPSKHNWERNPAEYTHAPLQSSQCIPLLRSAPVNYIHDATPCTKTLSANTNFFVDHSVPKRALQRIMFSMNKQVQEPWQWMFGDLAEGYEYLCVLDVQYDPEYKTQPQLRDRLQTCPYEGEFKEEPSERATPTQYSHSRPSSYSPSRIKYAEIDRYLLWFPGSCSMDPGLRYQTHIPTTDRSTGKRVLEAKALLAKDGKVLAAMMDAKRIPENLRSAYANGKSPLPECLSTWLDLKGYAEEIFDEVAKMRLLIIQAIHFKELLDECERLRKAEAELEPTGEEKRRIEGDGKQTENQKWRTKRRLATNDILRIGTINPRAKGLTSRPKSPVVPSKPPERAERISMSYYRQAQAVTPEKALQNSKIPTRNTPSKSEPRLLRPQHMKSPVQPQLTGSTLWYESPSPQLFFSDDSPDGSSQSRQYPRNAGSVLNREGRHEL